MKREEKYAFQYLKKRFNKEPQYEPEKNLPPDFLIEGIAIEVRLLNCNRKKDDSFEGTEQLQNKLRKEVHKISSKIKFNGESTYFITYTLNDVDIKTVKRLLFEKLKSLYQQRPNEETILDICGIQFHISPTVNSQRSFILAGYGDIDDNGVEADIYSRNMKLCIIEKANKVKKNASKKYEHWWLLFVDNLAYYPLMESVSKEIVKLDKDLFEKIILINKNSEKVFEF